MIHATIRTKKGPTMLRFPALAPVLTLCLLAQAGAVLAQATPSSAPPKLERIEEGSDTPITVTPPKGNNNKIVEKKEGGVTKEVTVKSGKSTYIMRPNVPAGNAQPGDGQSSAIRAPQWKVMEFDLGKKKKKTDKEDVPADTTPAPPPAAATPAK
jgi:hypothetical protein